MPCTRLKRVIVDGNERYPGFVVLRIMHVRRPKGANDGDRIRVHPVKIVRKIYELLKNAGDLGGSKRLVLQQARKRRGVHEFRHDTLHLTVVDDVSNADSGIVVDVTHRLRALDEVLAEPLPPWR